MLARTYLALMICGTAGGIGYTNLVVLGERVANARLIAAAPELVAVVAVGGDAADLAWDEIDALAGHAIRKVRGDS